MKTQFFAIAIVSLAVAGSQQVSAQIVRADAARIADETQAAWISMDASKIESRYARDIVVFDPTLRSMGTTWDAFHNIQIGFVLAKMDGLTVPDRKIQLLDDKTFIVSGTGMGTSSTGRQKQIVLRFTDVYRRQGDGLWLIVNEHISLPPRR